MKKENNANYSAEKRPRMTLADYYESLEIPVYTKKTEFINKVSERCEVSESTARNWVANRVRPQKPSYMRILSELTGIPEEDLFKN